MLFQNIMNQDNEEVYQMVVHFCCNHFLVFGHAPDADAIWLQSWQL